MADVSVEFGAKDVGLQESLKKIQGEMQTLEGKVKSGELSFEELESTMKRLGQVERLEKQLQAIGNESAGTGNKVENLGKDIQDAGNKSEKMGEQSGMGFGKLVAAVGLGQIAAKAFTAVLDSAFAAVRGTIQGFTDALDLGGRLSDLSASTGETAGKLLVLERAFDNSGIGADKVGSSIAKMQKNIEDARDGSGTAANAFAMMGVKVEELEGKLPTEQLKILSSGIQSIDDPTQRAAAAMGVFGKSGAELLPLLTNLDGELSDARDTVGSMAEIMDRRSSVFDAVSDRFQTISQKVRDFAAGILDRALPAIDAITTALSRIDAAKIGQDLANSFLGGQKAMSGFQAAVDAFKTGQISAGLGLLWESTKLQSMQTGNEIYKNLTAAFNTVASTIAKIFGPGSGTFTLVVDSFALIGKASAQKLAEGILNILPDINNGLLKTLEITAIALPGLVGPVSLAAKAADVALEALRGSMEGMKEDVKAQKEELTTSYNNFAANAKKSFSEIPEDFKTNLQSVPPLFDGITAQQNKVAELEKEVAAKVAETNTEREKTNEKLEKEKSRRAEIAAQAAANADKERQNSLQLVTLETEINEAKSAGNDESVKALEAEKKRLEDQKEIAKLTKEFLPLVNGNATAAARLATNFVNAKNAAAAIGDRSATVTVTTKVDDSRWKDLLAELALNRDPKTIAVALEVTGKSNLQDAQIALQNMERANKNFDAVFKVIGARSIEEVAANLNGIPTESQKQLALQITGETDIDRAIGKLDTFAGTKKAKALLETQGFEKMEELQNALKGVVGEKRTKAIVQTLGVDDVEDAKDAIDSILRNNGKKTKVTAEANTAPAQNAIDSLDARNVTVNAAADTTSASQAIDNLGGQTIEGNLDASESIQAIRKQLEKEVDLGLNASEGNKILGNIEGLLGDLKTVMETLSQKLPTPALV
jgi:hypothetical protein